LEKSDGNVFIVNGKVEKADGNLNNQFFVKQVGETNIFIGTYPSCDDDMDLFKSNNIEGVLNFMEDKEMTQYGCDRATTMRLLSKN